MSTVKVSNIQHASAASAAITLDANGQATLNGLNFPTAGSLSGRNRIINGDMRIDQRNAGTSINNASGAGIAFVVDRWNLYGSQASKLTGQRNAGSVTPPTGFKNYLGITSSSAYSVLTSDYFFLYQRLEGFNVSDLEWGTANASSVTVSFWVRSSLTGTFGGALTNNATDRCYPFAYEVSSANTWEKKTIAIAGDTTGTWETGNLTGIGLYFSLGAGSTRSGTAGAWSSSAVFSATGATSVVGTNGATFYITGVQLEAGTVATPFERRSYGQELALCQRYYYRINRDGQAYGRLGVGGQAVAPFIILVWTAFPVPMRIRPTALETTGTASDYQAFDASASGVTATSVLFNVATTVMAETYAIIGSYDLTPGNSSMLVANNTANAYLGWSAEL